MALLKFHTHREHSRTQDERRESLEFGKTGEQMAARYLADQGYVILEHNYRRGHLEIDLIALDKDEVVIVEVKHPSCGWIAMRSPHNPWGHCTPSAKGLHTSCSPQQVVYIRNLPITNYQLLNRLRQP